MTAPQPTGQAPADGGQGGSTPPEPQPTTTQPVTPAPTASATDEPRDVSSLPQWAQKAITDLRSEAANHRTGKQTAAQAAQAAQDRLDAILKAAGLKPDGTEAEPDPATYIAKIEQANSARWAKAVELEVFRTGKDVDAVALLDSRRFVDSLDAFVDDDPDDADFQTKLTAHIAAYVEANPQFKSQAAAPPAARAEVGGRKPNGTAATSPLERLAAQIRGESE